MRLNILLALLAVGSIALAVVNLLGSDRIHPKRLPPTVDAISGKSIVGR